MPLMHPYSSRDMMIFVVVQRYHSLIGQYIGYFHPLEDCLAPFATMRISLQGGSFHIRSISGHQGSVPEVHGVFSTGVLPSTSGI